MTSPARPPNTPCIDKNDDRGVSLPRQAPDREDEAVVLRIDRAPSPIGTVLIICNDKALCALEFAETDERVTRWLRRRFGTFDLRKTDNPLGISARLRAYFAGDLHAVDDIPVDNGGTKFQESVWTALRRIPPGTTMTYGALASRLGVPQANRAVGAANGQNPSSIVVPCHRLVGADGTLTGYSGGLERKRWLLAHEGAALPARHAVRR
jgi:methylated-DNA-[protein]-cysteine S-methyltransferase